MRNRSIAALAIVTAALLASMLLLVSCGGGETTYTNAKYHFSMTYDTGTFTESTDVSTASTAGGSAVFNVGFFDPNGTKASGQARDGVAVGVYQLNTTITDAMMPLVEKELKKILPQTAEGLGSGASIGTIKPVTINGVKGFVAPAKFRESGKLFKADLYFMISKNMEYQLTAQSIASRWSELEPQFKQMIDSFEVTK